KFRVQSYRATFSHSLDPHQTLTPQICCAAQSTFPRARLRLSTQGGPGEAAGHSKSQIRENAAPQGDEAEEQQYANGPAPREALRCRSAREARCAHEAAKRSDT